MAITNKLLNFAQKLGFSLNNKENIINQTDSTDNFLNGKRQVINSYGSFSNVNVENQNKAIDYFFTKQSKNISINDENRRSNYEASRLVLYMDYNAMAQYPILGQAIELLAEESTTSKDNKNNILNIYSKSDKVKEELEYLFNKRLSINTNLFYWCKNMLKYGDNFLYLHLNSEKGIVDVKQLTNICVERFEKEEEDGNYKLLFNYRPSNGGTQQEFQHYQIAHFRLLGDDNRLPYGQSVYEPVRRTYKQLFMMEDAVLVYRITRAAERRVYKIPVGTTDPADWPLIVQQVANQIKKRPLVDRNGDINFKFNVLTMDDDLFMPDPGNGNSTMIDTLPGASNLDAIGDLEYLRDNLFTGLGIHKSLLGFSSDSAPGDGKNLSMLDIRFARKIHRIQQSLIAELNKIAFVHLKILGGDYEAYLDDFSITLNSPSTALELLKNEQWNGKLDLFIKATTPNPATGIKPMSESKARKLYLEFSEEEIVDDLFEQFLENKIAEEIKNAPQLLRSSKLFDKMIKFANSGVFKDLQGNILGQNNQQNQEQGGDMNDMMGGDLGGGPPTGGMSNEPVLPIGQNGPGGGQGTPILETLDYLSKKEPITKISDDLDNILNKMDNMV